MTDPRLAYEQRRYVALCEWVRANDPEIDERTLANTVEGLSDYTDALATIVRGALDDEDIVEAIKRRIAVMADRLKRFEDRAEKRRAIVREQMIEAGLDRLAQPEFTATLRRSSPAVQVIDESQIPQTYWEHRPHLRKDLLRDDLKDGRQIPGASLNNPGMNLSVRTR
jgi:hypothetical protein